MRILLAKLAAVAALAPTGFTATAQEPAYARESLPDSQQLRRMVESAQANFERFRFGRLPVSFGYGSGTCDEQVGRYCYWHDSDDSWKPDPEDPEVLVERARLRTLLDSVAAILPADSWIVGQRVRYAIEGDDTSDALGIARSCQSERWWCLALEGYVLHSSGSFDQAERVFGSALLQMSPERRCEWDDMSFLLRGRLSGQYGDLECENRLSLESRIWWLADPLYLVPGNERKTEHYSRLVLDEILSESRTVRRSRWGNDNRELLVRYGQIAGWERARSRSMSLTSGDRVIGHHNPGGLHLLPQEEIIADLSRLEPLTWDLEPDRPQSEYAPSYTKGLRWLEHDAVLFRSADSAVVVASFLLPRPDSLIDSTKYSVPADVQTALFAAESELAPRFIQRGIGARPLALTIPLGTTVVSIEALSRTDSIAARARYWLDAKQRLDNGTNGFSMSEILLVDGESGLPQTLAAAIPTAHPPGDLDRDANVGLFWEMYGIDSTAQTATMSIRVEKEGKGFFRKVGELFGVVGERQDQIEMRWEEAVASGRPSPRAVAVRFTEKMEGDYVISVQVRLDTGQAARTQRRVTVSSGQ